MVIVVEMREYCAHSVFCDSEQIEHFKYITHSVNKLECSEIFCQFSYLGC